MQKYFTSLIVLLPLIGQYGFMTQSISIAEVLLLVPVAFEIVQIVKKKEVKIKDKEYTFFALWFLLSAAIISPLISGYSSTHVWMVSLQNLFYFVVVIVLASNYFNYTWAIELYNKMSILMCVIVLIQKLIFIISGSTTPWVINSSIFPTIYATEDYFKGGYEMTISMSGYRPSALFTEPAMFAQFVSPCLALMLLDRTKAKNWKQIILISFSTLIAQSANGTIYIIVIWMYYFAGELYQLILSRQNKVRKNTTLLLLFGAMVVPLLIGFGIEKSGGLANLALVDRLIEIFDVRGVSSGSMRVLRGWIIFSKLQLGEKIIGIENGTIVEYLENNPNIVPLFEKAWNGYMSGLSSIFISAGIVGGDFF